MTDNVEQRQIDTGDGNTDSGSDLTGGYGGSTGTGGDPASLQHPADLGSQANDDAEGRAVSTDPDALGSTADGPGLTEGGTGTAIPEELLARANVDEL